MSSRTNPGAHDATWQDPSAHCKKLISSRSPVRKLQLHSPQPTELQESPCSRSRTHRSSPTRCPNRRTVNPGVSRGPNLTARKAYLVRHALPKGASRLANFAVLRERSLGLQLGLPDPGASSCRRGSHDRHTDAVGARVGAGGSAHCIWAWRKVSAGTAEGGGTDVLPVHSSLNGEQDAPTTG